MRISMLLHKSVEFDSRVRREAATLAEAGHQVTVLELARVPAGVSTLDGFARRSVLPSLLVRRLLPFHASARSCGCGRTSSMLTTQRCSCRA